MPAHKTDWFALLGETAPELQAQFDRETAHFNDKTQAYEEATYDRDQIITIAEHDVDTLAGLGIPSIFTCLFPPVLKAAWQLLTTYGKRMEGFPQIALGIPRSHAKTTLVKLFILYCILFTKKQFILLISSTGPLAENGLADIKDMLNEPNIIAAFGDWKIGIETNRNDLVKFGFRGRNIVLAAIGAEGSMRGLNIKNIRPDVMVFDDIQTKEQSESAVQSDALLRWMLGTAMKAKSPHGCLFIFSGNMYPGPNSILRKLKGNKNWIKFISGAILADGTALWPELRPLKDLIEELDNDIAMGHPEIFFSEVLNDTEAGVNTKTNLSQIKPWPWSEGEICQGKFIVIDPAAGIKGRDDTAIGYFEVYDEVPALRQVVEENLSPGNTIRRALLLAIQTRSRLIAVEATAYQTTLLYWFGIIAEQLSITGIQFVPVNTGQVSKNSRISSMLKSLTNEELYLHDSVRNQVIFQITNWNPLKKDNVDGILDLLAHCQKVLELYPEGIIAEEELFIKDMQHNGVQEYNSSF